MSRICGGAMLWTGALTLCAVAPVAWAQSASPAAADVKAIDIEVAGRPLREIATTLSAAAGVPIAVEPRIQEWKATVAYRGNLDTLLNLLCREFRLVAEERPAEAKGADHARHSLYLRLTDAERRRLDEHEAERERKERERRERDVKTLVDRIQKLLNDPDPEGPHGPEGGLVPAGTKPALDLLRSLGPGAIGALADSVRPGNDGSEWSPAVNVPTSSLSPAQRSLVTACLTNHRNSLQHGNAGSSPGANANDDGFQNLDGGTVGFATTDRDGNVFVGLMVQFGGKGGRVTGFPVFGAGPPLDHRSGKADDQKETPPPDSQPDPRQESAKVTLDLSEADYGEAALAVAKAGHVNVVADYFTLAERLTAFPKDAPLRDVLERVCGAFHASRRWEHGSLLLRREQWEDRATEEPTAAALDWLGGILEKPHMLTFDEMAQLASKVNREQLPGLVRWRWRAQNMKTEARELGAHYALYHWCGSLSQEHRSTLLAGGMKVGALPLREGSAFAQLAARRGGLRRVPPAALVSLRQNTMRYPPIVALEVRAPNDEVVGEIR